MSWGPRQCRDSNCSALAHGLVAVPFEMGVEACGKCAVQRPGHLAVTEDDVIHCLRVVVGPDLAQVVSECPEYLHLPPRESGV